MIGLWSFLASSDSFKKTAYSVDGSSTTGVSGGRSCKEAPIRLSSVKFSPTKEEDKILIHLPQTKPPLGAPGFFTPIGDKSPPAARDSSEVARV